MTTQQEKAARFRSLHAGPFVIPNPWDAVSARVLASLGFQALATSSSAMANVCGRRDGELTRAETLGCIRAIVAATDLPVSGDLGDHFCNDVSGVAETVGLAAEAGLVGCSIEDSRTGSGQSLLEIGLATERVAVAVQAARALPFPFTLTARAENFIRPNPSLDDTIKRLVAYEKAGADVLFAPGLPSLDAVREVCAAVTRPVNFMAGIKGKSFTVAELVAAGVRRISLGGSLYRAAMTSMVEAAREIRDEGTFVYTDRCMSTPDWYALL